MSYLLFVQSSAALERACREVSEFFTFQSRRAAPVSHELLGVWVEADALLHLPLKLASPSKGASGHGIYIGETLGVAGIWELARLHLPPHLTLASDLRVLLIESLLSSAAQQAPGVFAPVFPGPPVRPMAYSELARLRHRYPHVLAPPLMQDPDDGALIWEISRAVVRAFK